MINKCPSLLAAHLARVVGLLALDAEHSEALHVRGEVNLRHEQSLLGLLTLVVWLQRIRMIDSQYMSKVHTLAGPKGPGDLGRTL